ncbi:ATP-binding cassette domain-containing protein [Dysgonomonas sp. 511]|uniref:ATP-binding cassette domain-containing protein n=1 Tax=Dysgonomonas sp. 511 TaxID=2302930 RepID=UPI0013D79E1B|nr:ATP-binding cassette domain-containing protein [Dysgonomonas sp. 511]NDV79932.1 ATP-binding cassette domain-containing protein [Dysgonomonas sp. 511]
MSQRAILKISEATTRLQQVRFSAPISWELKTGEQWAVIGRNGSGKTLFTDTMTGKYALSAGEILCFDENGEKASVYATVKSVAFRDIYSIIDAGNSYYQQRWNKGVAEEVPSVRHLLSEEDIKSIESGFGGFDISDLMDKEVNLLSSGELRKFLIIRSLLARPRVLILDNPYIGLDAPSRLVLNHFFEHLAQSGISLILVLSNPGDIPDVITHVLPIQGKKLLPALSKDDFLSNKSLIDKLFPDKAKSKEIGLPIKEGKEDSKPTYTDVALLKNIKVKYGESIIIDGLDWQIARGDKWALLGANGSGKSTLLSLIYGDNPQGYANDITLFDRKRGSGESIWDIKNRIGYISPEMHLYYMKNIRCIDIVGSGFFDTIGLYRKCSTEQEAIALLWMDLLGIGHLKDSSFLHISSGEQRLVLLARVFVKDPELLILDEPLHGLDMANKRLVKRIVETFCTCDKTLIYVTHYESEIPGIVDKRMVLTKKK